MANSCSIGIAFGDIVTFSQSREILLNKHPKKDTNLFNDVYLLIGNGGVKKATTAIDTKEYKLMTKGISKGCPLSPLMGAIILKSLDNKISEKNNVLYIRYMDDWVILTKTKVVLRKYIKLMHQTIKKFKLAFDKTYIGKISKGFDFLGYRFNHFGLIGLAKKTVVNFINKATKLYERGASDQRICCYFNNWRKWTTAGITRT